MQNMITDRRMTTFPAPLPISSTLGLDSCRPVAPDNATSRVIARHGFLKTIGTRKWQDGLRVSAPIGVDIVRKACAEDHSRNLKPAKVDAFGEQC